MKMFAAAATAIALFAASPAAAVTFEINFDFEELGNSPPSGPMQHIATADIELNGSFIGNTNINFSGTGLASTTGVGVVAPKGTFELVSFDVKRSALDLAESPLEFIVFTQAPSGGPGQYTYTLGVGEFGGTFSLANLIPSSDPKYGFVSPFSAIGFVGYDALNFDNVRIAYTPNPLGSAVPEPATWSMLIAGFGLAGSGLRAARRSRAAQPA